MENTSSRLNPLISKYRKYLPASFFILGFVYDLLTLGRIDSYLNIFQQILFIFLIGSILLANTLVQAQRLAVAQYFDRPYRRKIWEYRNEILHFILGSLLSAFTIFYFKSSSSVSSFFFIVLLTFLLIANEFERFKNFGLSMKYTLLALCVVSFFIYVIPTLIGSIGTLIFILSMVVSCLALAGYIWLLRKMQLPPANILKFVTKPFASVVAIYSLLYFLQVIPPVPLSLQFVGIYHDIAKSTDGHYRLDYEASWWKFWQKDDRVFVAQPGDQLYCFTAIFSPTDFDDQVVYHWLLLEKTGWTSQDRIPIRIHGGREEGFRAYAQKRNFVEGRWQIRIETTTGREIGRTTFKVVTATEPDPSRILKSKYF